MEEIVQALELKKQLDGLRPIDKEQEAKIMQKFRLDWNYHSNNLEGNSLTYGETKALIMFGLTAQGKPLKDHSEIKGHNDAILWIEEIIKGERPLTENLIRELHEVLLVEPYEADAQASDGQPTKKRISIGSYKTSPNHVRTSTGEIFYFATPEETPAEMAALMEWYNQKIQEKEVNPILLAAEFHYKFIRIHPFDDGNGRTARILMNFILMKFGYPPVIIKTEDKANYFSALQLADAGNIEAFVTYIAKNLVRSLQIMVAGAKGEDTEEPDDIDKEIALLEKRLSALGERSNIGKTKESVRALLDNICLKIYNKLIEKSKVLNQLYLKHELFFYIPSSINKPYNIHELKQLNLHSFASIQMVVLYSKFTTVGFNEFSYATKLKIKFLKTKFLIYNEDDEKIIEKPYGVDIVDEQLDSIVIPEIKRHKDFIEQKIAEKEQEL
ncbi:hypothetical protein CHU92_09475 [Flavobacterium cyanobacteriorum]|uniref:Fido domain-containing protein n=1 Tax=Flavobacterium cyanobacteriorum TaxID=2022802 RepID=A0A255Z7L1_9FLAO|nr:Fic family protein [Flavobacterium cyanobacteriorum]OYQ36620.1 hypothetical protein CHU92_09475 [Flavobacterium cyanobacteriorum]